MNKENSQRCSETKRNDTKNLDDPTLYFMEIGMSQGIETKSPSPLVESSLSCSRQNIHSKPPIFTLSGDIQQDEKSVISVPSLQFADEADDRYSSPLQEPETIIISSAQDRYSSVLQEAESIDISTKGVVSAPSFRFCETIDETDEKYTSSFQESELDDELPSAITISSTDPLQEAGTMDVSTKEVFPAPSFRFCETIDEIDEKDTSSCQESELDNNLSSAITTISRVNVDTLPSPSLEVSDFDNNPSSAIIARDDAESLPLPSSPQGLDLDNNLSSAIKVGDDAKKVPPLSSVSFFETFDDQVLSSFQESKTKSTEKVKKGASTDAAALHAMSSASFVETLDDQVLSSYQESKSESIKKAKEGALAGAATPHPVLNVPFFETLDDQVLSSFHETKSESSIKQGDSIDAANLVPRAPFSEKVDRQVLSPFQKSKLEACKTLKPVRNSSFDKGESQVTASEVDSCSIGCDKKIPISRFQFFEKIDDQHLSSFQDSKPTDIRSFHCQSTKRTNSVQRRKGESKQSPKTITHVADGENHSSQTCFTTRLENSESDCPTSEELYDEDLTRKIALHVLTMLSSLSEELKTETNQCNKENRCEVGDRLYSFSATKQTAGKEYRRRIADERARANPPPPPLPKKKILNTSKTLHSDLKTARHISDSSVEVVLMAKDRTKNKKRIQAQDKNSCIEMDDRFRFERLHGLSDKKQQLGKERRKRIEIERERMNPSKPLHKIVQLDSTVSGLHLKGTADTCGLSLDSS